MTVEKVVLSYCKIEERLKKYPEDRARVLSSLEEMRADFDRKTIGKLIKFLDLALKKFYDGIHLIDDAVVIPELLKTSSLVMVPNHQSHADYVAVNYMFYKTYKTPLYVAGGDNLNIFPIGKIFRKCACFFLRRSFQGDIVYRLTFEAYLYYLLRTGKPIEFFFEGGRTRSGKLLSPKFGLFTMLMEAHSNIPTEHRKPLLFLPVSIVHQYVPEQKSLTRELDGAKKKKESGRQLLKLFYLFSKQFGEVYIQFGKPVCAAGFVPEGDKPKKETIQQCAFECFREVGRNMSINPSALLSLALLDEPVGALKWGDLITKGREIISYCKKYNIPFTPSLEDQSYEKTMKRAMDIFIINKKVEALGDKRKGGVFYSVGGESRKELLFFKNTILHHFLIPWMINNTWISVFNGKIKTIDQLKSYLIEQKNQLKYEFYLPTTRELFSSALELIGDAIGRKVEGLEDILSFSHEDLYNIGKKVGPFARNLSYLFEGHYITLLALEHLSEKSEEYSFNKVYETCLEIHREELQYGKIVKYAEGISKPLVKTALEYFSHEQLLDIQKGTYCNVELDLLESFIHKYERELIDHLSFKMVSFSD